MSRKTFDFESFPGAAGTDITAIAPTSSDSASPYFTVTGGSLKTDGNGNLTVASGSNAKGLMPSPSSGQFDAEIDASSVGVGGNFGFYLEQDAATYYAYVGIGSGGPQTITLGKAGGNGTSDMPSATISITGSPAAPYSFIVQKRISGGHATLTPIFNGTTYAASTDTNPNLASVPSAASVLVTGGSATITRFDVVDPAGTPNPATVTLSGPTSGTSGSESTAFTATLDNPARTGGTVVNLASSVSGDTFHATTGGSAVTSVTIAPGATSGTFLLVPSAAGSRNVSITSTGLTVAGSPIAYSATAPAVVATNATGYSLATSAASVATGTAETITATLTGGTALASNLVIALSDSLGSTISGTITIANGSTTGTATITPSAAGTHAITGTHTGGGFTGGDGSTSFAATATATPAVQPTNTVKSKAINFSPGLIGTAGFGYTLLDANLAPIGAMVTTGINAFVASNGTTYVANVPAGTYAVEWAEPGQTAIQVMPDLASIGSLTVTGITYDQFTAFFAARDAADVTALQGAFVDFMAQRAALIATLDARNELAITGAAVGSVANLSPTAIGSGTITASTTVSCTMTGAALAPAGSYVGMFLKPEAGPYSGVRRLIATHTVAGTGNAAVHTLGFAAYPGAPGTNILASIV